MYSTRGWGIAALCVSLASSAPAQTVAEYTKRVDSLAAVWRAAVGVQARADSVRVHALPSDTIRVGNLVVLSDQPHRDLAKETAEIVSPRLDRAYGAWATRMRAHVLVVRAPTLRLQADSGNVESGVVGPDGRVWMNATLSPTTDALAASWTRKAEEYLTRDLDPSLRDWLGIPFPIPSEPTTSRALSAGRTDLVLSPSQVAHECALGRPTACLQALNLVPVADPAFTLFDKRQRMAMIEWYSFVLQRRDPGKYQRCMSAGREATCDSLVRAIPLDAVPKPVPPSVRLDFVRYALVLGGDGAFDRLATPSGTVADRIAAAAKTPIDTLVSRWQANLMSSRSASTAIDATTAISSILWACLCGALALRSSRWR
jgi:hypothetical protein